MLRQQIVTMTQQLYDKSIKIKSLWINQHTLAEAHRQPYNGIK